MEPRGAMIDTAGPLLLEYVKNGCPVEVERLWSKEETMTVVERRPYKSAL